MLSALGICGSSQNFWHIRAELIGGDVNQNDAEIIMATAAVFSLPFLTLISQKG
jgi:thiamine monophosphate kinase